MQFALIEGERRDAQPGLSAECPLCGKAMTAKCGMRRVWHWAHRGTRTCDHWWEPETERHRGWKNHFPKDWQEIIHAAGDGEKHIADVKTAAGVVLEFQHSPLSRDEREARELFYQHMVWIVDARRRVRAGARFLECLESARPIGNEPLILSTMWNEGALLRDWEGSRVPVYFDFGDQGPDGKLPFNQPTLWRLNPHSRNGGTYLSPVAKALFLQAHSSGQPLEENYASAVERAVAYRARPQLVSYPQLTGFERYMARRQGFRRRF